MGVELVWLHDPSVGLEYVGEQVCVGLLFSFYALDRSVWLLLYRYSHEQNLTLSLV